MLTSVTIFCQNSTVGNVKFLNFGTLLLDILAPRTPLLGMSVFRECQDSNIRDSAFGSASLWPPSWSVEPLTSESAFRSASLSIFRTPLQGVSSFFTFRTLLPKVPVFQSLELCIRGVSSFSRLGLHFQECLSSKLWDSSFREYRASRIWYSSRGVDLPIFGTPPSESVELLASET
jgi:hypothetical protein